MYINIWNTEKLYKWSSTSFTCFWLFKIFRDGSQLLRIWKWLKISWTECWMILELEDWLPFNQKMIHGIFLEKFGQRRSLWSLLCVMSLMSSLCQDEFFMANNSVMEISHPPYSVKNVEKDWTAKINAVSLDVFSDDFVQLLEMCKKWIAVK
jgi:hypothetical protein